jgi:hypothetical protein
VISLNWPIATISARAFREDGSNFHITDSLFHSLSNLIILLWIKQKFEQHPISG